MDSVQKKIWSPWATAGWGLLIFIVWTISQTIPFFFASALLRQQNGGKEFSEQLKALTGNSHVLALAVLIGALVAFGFIWLIIFARRGAKFPEYLGLHPLKWKTALGVQGFALLFCLASDLLTYSLGRDIVPQFQLDFYPTSGSPALLILGVCLVGPLFEEIYFRGFIFEGLRNSKLGNVGAALLTTAAWAGLHTQYNVYEITTLFAGGLVLAYLRVVTGTLWSCVLFHIVTNTWSTVETVLFFHGMAFLHLSKV
jgi:membrane protease YdiL (CAAX protease family)